MLPQRQPLDENSPEIRRLSKSADRILVPQPALNGRSLLPYAISYRGNFVSASAYHQALASRTDAETVTSSVF